MVTKRYVVEVSPSLDYLKEVVRELRWKNDADTHKDPFLQRIYEQRRFKLVWGEKNPWKFRFDVTGRKHHKAQVYTLFQHGLLGKEDRVTFGKNEPILNPEILGPPLEELTPEKLLQLLQELEVLEVMSS